MRFELFNSSLRDREVPKFKYNGTMVLKGKTSVSITEEMIPFYKPFEVKGLVVRKLNDVIAEKSETKAPIVEEVKKEGVPVEEVKKEGVPVEEVETEKASVKKTVSKRK